MSDLSELTVWEWVSESLKAHSPTRFVCLVPSQPVISPHFLEIARFSRGSPIFDSSLSQTEMSLLLVQAENPSLLIQLIGCPLLNPSHCSLTAGFPAH